MLSWSTSYLISLACIRSCICKPYYMVLWWNQRACFHRCRCAILYRPCITRRVKYFITSKGGGAFNFHQLAECSYSYQWIHTIIHYSWPRILGLFLVSLTVEWKMGCWTALEYVNSLFFPKILTAVLQSSCCVLWLLVCKHSQYKCKLNLLGHPGCITHTDVFNNYC